VRSAGDGYDLVEGLFGANHAEIGAGAFFRGLFALFEIDNLSVERLIAFVQQLVLVTLLGNGSAQIARLAKALGREPELTLQSQPYDSQNQKHPA